MNEVFKVTHIPSKKIWIESNINHSWCDLCLHIMKKHKHFQLIYCDIEGIVFLNGEWCMLDECGRWETIPNEYKVEVQKESVL